MTEEKNCSSKAKYLLVLPVKVLDYTGDFLMQTVRCQWQWNKTKRIHIHTCKGFVHGLVFGWTCVEPGVALHDSCSSLPTQDIIWFYDSY